MPVIFLRVLMSYLVSTHELPHGFLPTALSGESLTKPIDELLRFGELAATLNEWSLGLVNHYGVWSTTASNGQSLHGLLTLS